MRIPHDFLSKFTPVSAESQKAWDSAINTATAALKADYPRYAEAERLRGLRTEMLSKTIVLD